MPIQLSLILGPMFAGKSTFMITKINTINEQIRNAGKNPDSIITVNHSSDARYDSGKICSHDGLKKNCITTDKLSNIPMNTFINAEYIFIDEGQFFNDLYDVITNIIKLSSQSASNKFIFISGLDGDYNQRPFSNSRILELIPYATIIIKLTARCYKCGEPAPMTKRLINSNETILVGGADMYQPCCYLHM